MKRYETTIESHFLLGAVSAAALIGAVIGQILFGFLADILGRRVCMIITCTILILGGLICSLASGGSPTGTIWVLIVARGFLGVGIGGMSLYSQLDLVSLSRR
jgi:PHS family inorganic phosphate transporter-like MFS transporter